MILPLLLALTSASARADAVRFTDGAMIYGSVVGMTGDAVEIIVAKDQFDAEDWEKARASPHPGFLVLRDGTVLRAVDATLSDASADLRIPRAQIAGVDTSAAAPSAPAVPPPPGAAAPPPPATVPGFLSPSPADRPDAASSANTYGVDGGIFIPRTKLTVQGTDTIAGTGYEFGALALHRVAQAPFLEFGAGLEDVSGGAHQSSALITNFQTTTRFRSLMGMALARVSTDAGRLRLRLLGGVGFASTNFSLGAQPNAGFVWADTFTSESRSLVNTTQTSAMLMLRPEVDARFTDNVGLGASLSYIVIASANYDPTSAGQAAGFESSSLSFYGIALSGNLYVKF